MRSSYITLMMLVFCQSCMIDGRLGATDLRAPLPSFNGPLRLLHEYDGRDDASVKVWSVASYRQASKCYMDHGMTSEPYSALIFNASDFRVADSFYNSLIPLATEFYSPLLRTAHIHTAAEYTESTMTVGIQWMYPVYEDRGRFGVRVKVPFKRVEIDRTDQSGVRGGAELQDVKAIQPVVAATTSPDFSPAVQSQMLRFDFAEALIQSSDKNSVFNFSGTPQVGGKDVSAVLPSTDATAAQLLAVVKSPEGLIPRAPSVLANVATVKVDTSTGSTPTTPLIPTDYVELPADGTADVGKIYKFRSESGFYKNLLDENAVDATSRRAVQGKKETLWLIPFAHETSPGVLSKTVKGVENGSPMFILQELSQQATENAYEWLHDRGYDFESDSVTGVGDISLEFFYQHDLGKDLSLEGAAGVFVPINRERTLFANPYTARAGNGGHWQIFGSLQAGWQLLKAANVRFSGTFGVALPETEQVCATFTGSLIKNLGPKIEAEIDWRYAIMNVDLTLFHPESDTFSFVGGYQFYWKGSDKVSFKVDKYQGWLGKIYNATTGNYDTYEVDLSPEALRKNTDSIGHRVRVEASLRLGAYCELFAGGAYTFAGKHVARDIDTHFGVHLTF